MVQFCAKSPEDFLQAALQVQEPSGVIWIASVDIDGSLGLAARIVAMRLTSTSDVHRARR